MASCVVDSKIREKSLGNVVNDLKSEAKEFVSTRVQMLTTEMKEKAGIFKIVVPMVAVAFVFAWVGFFALTAAFIAVIAMGLGGTILMWAAAALIVAVVYFAIAGVLAGFAMQHVRAKGLAPRHTMNVLKQDQVWLRTEAQAQM